MYTVGSHLFLVPTYEVIEPVAATTSTARKALGSLIAKNPMVFPQPAGGGGEPGESEDEFLN